VHEGLCADRDLVAEDDRDLVRVARAAEVAEQRDPVDRLAGRRVEAGFLADVDGQQARAQLRLERLAEGVVLGEGERRDELTQAKRRIRYGESSRCVAIPSRYTLHRSPSRKEGSR
jgi:hypothetical protein